MKKINMTAVALLLMTMAALSQETRINLPGTNVYADWNKRAHKNTDVCTCTLDDVLFNGNSSGHDINITGGTGQINIDNGLGINSVSDGTQLYVQNGSTVLARIGEYSGIGQVWLKDPASIYSAIIQSGSLNGARTYETPDWNGKLVTRINFQDIFVTIPGVSQPGAAIQYNAFHLKDTAGYSIAGVFNNSGIGEFRLTEPGSVTAGYWSSLRQSPMSANQYFYLPGNGGNILVNTSGASSQTLSLTFTMTVTHGQPFTPSSVQWTPTDFPPLGGDWKVGNITATTFDVIFKNLQTGVYSGYFMCYP